ncbi:glycoside hydrolase family 43 protein [Sediminitomix flava]|uniref:Alpha-N-arabinofuranosidase n=1 Tax=Sediminitomix flava TaxID=379075 RepID=A0A315Z496_SEDFL|nr:glycoside hydrolase family 43 protein [Sediminitomix flava]PWJ37894.1 alpha-N-arabinofuranosidase [Sediminitomix flava]
MRPFYIYTLLFLCAFWTGEKACFAQNFNNSLGEDHFQNPIISGFHPDPSICRVGDDYYLVNSSFEWFPGVPIFHSKDLVNWQQIGHVLDRKSQLNMVNTKASAGIWAPTIRYHEGKYYVVVTCKQSKNDCNCGNNFYVTADSPEGPWSDPIWIKNSLGIDPTIFWDDDGKVYYLGSTHEFGRNWEGEDRIYLQELQLETGELLGKPQFLTSGHASNARFTEGPHIYKIKDKYLLLAAEGGTWNDHAITGFLADSITGPYAPIHANPLLTHRHLGKNYPLTTIGHGDLVQTQHGDWWGVMLGVRKLDGNYYLGRESYLTAVEFQGTKPVFNAGIGKVQLKEKRPDLPLFPFTENPIRDDFTAENLGLQWNFLRTPQTDWLIQDTQKARIGLPLRAESVKERANPSLLARRLEHFEFEVKTKMTFSPKKENETAGLIALQNERFHYRFCLVKEGKENFLTIVKAFNAKNRKVYKETEVARVPYAAKEVVLGMKVNGMDIQFYYGKSENELKEIGAVQSANALCSNFSGGFIGAYVGMYASSNGQKSKQTAWFDWFEYAPNKNVVP